MDLAVDNRFVCSLSSSDCKITFLLLGLFPVCCPVLLVFYFSSGIVGGKIRSTDSRNQYFLNLFTAKVGQL